MGSWNIDWDYDKGLIAMLAVFIVYVEYAESFDSDNWGIKVKRKEINLAAV